MPTDTASKSGRHVKGTNLIDLVKVLRRRQRTKPFAGLTPGARALLSERILTNQWYPYEPFCELLEVTYRQLLGSNPANALEMGILGGMNQLQGAHRAFVTPGDPLGSALSTRHLWRAYFDFGEMQAVPDGERAVLFTIERYDDISEVHGCMTSGWGVAAARLAGAEEATAEHLERPWLGDLRFRYRVSF